MRNVYNPGTDDEEELDENGNPISPKLPSAKPAAMQPTPTSGIDMAPDESPEGAPPATPTGEIKDPKSLAGELKNSKYYLNQYEQLANDPKYAAQLPPDTRSSLKQAIADAKSMYDQKTSMNDWMEVAQTLSRAMAQYGAAAQGLRDSGKYGQNMSNVQFGPGIDYEGRNRRALEEYNMGVRGAKDLGDADRQAFLDEQSGRNKEYGEKAGMLKEGITATTQAERIAEQERAANLRYGASDRRADARQKQADDRQSEHERALQYRDLDAQEKSLSKQLQAGQSLANNLQSEDSLSSKDAEKLKVKYGSLAANAGVDLPSSLNDYQKSAPKRQRQFMGMSVPGTETTDTESPQNKQSLYDALGLTEKLKQLEDIKRQKQQLTHGSSAQGGSQQNEQPAPQSQAAPTQSDRVKVRSPDGQVGSVPRAQLNDALAKGYKQVD